MSIEVLELIEQSSQQPLNTLVDVMPKPPIHVGKVREMYEVDDQRLLCVATDRISAFDVVMNEPIPGKGVILTQLSSFWFQHLRRSTPNHFISADQSDFPEPYNQIPELAGRSMLVKKAKRIDLECVVRGFLSGSAWAEYSRFGTVAGVEQMPGHLESAVLPYPLFTPAIKASTGHDENISIAEMNEILKGRYDPNLAEKLSERLPAISHDLYRRARDYCLPRRLILADTKFEFGLLDGEVILIDEALTPDSSRYWPFNSYQPGGPQPSFDKQPLRDYLESTGWNKEPPPPPLPIEVIEMTSQKYLEAYRRLVA